MKLKDIKKSNKILQIENKKILLYLIVTLKKNKIIFHLWKSPQSKNV